jgi:hypothetical protein
MFCKTVGGASLVLIMGLMGTPHIFFVASILGVPGGNVNILGGHSIGHYKQKSVYVHVSYSEWFLR